MPVKQLADANTDGTVLGQSAADLISMYGGTAVSRRASSIQAASVVSASTFITVGSNLALWAAEVNATMTGLGAWKGAA